MLVSIKSCLREGAVALKCCSSASFKYQYTIFLPFCFNLGDHGSLCTICMEHFLPLASAILVNWLSSRNNFLMSDSVNLLELALTYKDLAWFYILCSSTCWSISWEYVLQEVCWFSTMSHWRDVFWSREYVPPQRCQDQWWHQGDQIGWGGELPI